MTGPVYGIDLGVPGEDTTVAVATLRAGDELHVWTAGIVELAAAMGRTRFVFDDTAARVRAFMRALGGVRWAAIHADYALHGRTRPDGRPRRTGHRHRGTPAWTRRHG